MAKLSAKLIGTTGFLNRLKQIATFSGKRPVIYSVGYTANYAIYVHEMVDANFKRPGAKAKFLEEPLRLIKEDLVNTVKTALKNGATLDQAMLLAALKLQRESQTICPVDTGNLRASAFTRKEQ